MQLSPRHRFASRFSLFLLALALACGLAKPLPAQSYGEEAQWTDAALNPKQKEMLGGTTLWRRVAAALSHLTPAPAQPLMLKSACLAKIDSAFYRDLEARGATVTHSRSCTRLLIWLSEGAAGATYTFPEIQKKFLPLDGPEEAISFVAAAGGDTGLSWYGAVLDSAIFLMADKSYCNGLGEIRTIYRMDAGGNAVAIGTVSAPPPKNAGCDKPKKF